MNQWLVRRLDDVIGQYVLLGSHVTMDRNLPSGAVRLLLVLRQFAGPRSWMEASLDDVGLLMGLSGKQVGRLRDELVGRKLLLTTRGKGDGLTSLLPPDCEMMEEVFDDVQALKGDSTRDRNVHSPIAVLPPPRGKRSPQGVGTAAQLHRGRTEKTAHKTDDEPKERALPRAFAEDQIDPKLLAVALAVKMKATAKECLGVSGRPDDPSVTWHDVMAWLEAGVHWSTLLRGWQTWLAQERRGLDDAPDPESQLYVAMRGRLRFERGGTSRRAFNVFNDWLLAGGEMASLDDLQRLPVHEVLDLKDAARRVRTKRRLHVPATRLHIERSELYDLSLAGAGFRLVVADMADQYEDIYIDVLPSQLVFGLVVGVIDHRESEICFDDPATAVTAADELLEAGVIAPHGLAVVLPDEQLPACMSTTSYHAEKHRLREETGEVCAACSDTAVVDCHGRMSWSVDLDRAVVHEDTLWCTGCLAALVSEQAN
jgi:hypothetical protein